MKNKEFKTLMAVITLTGTLIMSMTAGAAPVYAADTNTASVTTETTTDTVSKTSTVKPYKDETVYATIDGNGTVKSITVSDQLKNIADSKEVKDKSDLKDIENIKGDETFQTTGNTLVWNTADADICYQGTTTKELPVGVNVTYTLDGKKINADELTGKSGHLIIRYTYQNKTSESTGETTPFLMATGLMLDSAQFKNVTVTNGKLISDGEKNMAVGFGFPAILEMLGTSEPDIPDYFEVEADVTNYAPVSGITIATNNLFNDLETDGFNSLADLRGSMNQLQSASNQLVEGSGELRTGLDTLLSSSGTLTDGIRQLVDGSTTLAGGTQTLKNGAGELSSGLSTASSKVSTELLPGIQALDAGVSQMQGSLQANLPTLANGVNSLDSGLSQVADGTAALSNGISQVANGTAALNAGLTQAGTGVGALYGGIQALAAKTGADSDLALGIANIQSGTSALGDALTAAAQNPGPITYAASSDSWDEINTLQSLLDSGTLPEEAAANITGVIASLQSEQNERDIAPAAGPSSISDTLNYLAGQAYALSQGSATISSGISALNAQFNPGDGTTLADGVAQLDAALNPGTGTITSAAAQLNAALNTGDGTNPSLVSAAAQLDAALNAGDASSGTSSIREGASALNQAVNGEGGLTEQVTNGVSQLKGGTSQLVAGVGGENGLASGLNLLSDGALRLASGSNELNTGASALASGLGTLQNGSGALIDGVQQLDDGAAQLNNGMIQFNEEGIQKLVNAFGGDIEGLLDKANNMLDASRKYKNFSGITDNMDGEVKFIFITE